MPHVGLELVGETLQQLAPFGLSPSLGVEPLRGELLLLCGEFLVFLESAPLLGGQPGDLAHALQEHRKGARDGTDLVLPGQRPDVHIVIAGRRLFHRGGQCAQRFCGAQPHVGGQRAGAEHREGDRP
jgi:hypothetical protein